jgi:hypothetical protein
VISPQRSSCIIDQFYGCGHPDQIGDVELGQQAEAEQFGLICLADGQVDEPVEGVEGSVSRQACKLFRLQRGSHGATTAMVSPLARRCTARVL